MDNSIYVTLSRQLALFRDMDVSANNIANANTTGYNAEHIQFSSYLSKDLNQGNSNPISFAYNPSTYRDMSNGSLHATGNDLDVAIQGQGYFTLQTPLGPRYTRNGNFQIDGAGTLVSVEGYPVLDVSAQPISLPENVTKIEIGEAGNLKVNNEDYGVIGIVQFENPQMLERLNGTMFKSDATPHAAENVRLAQGMLENANVVPVAELTHIVNLNRSVAGTAKFIEIVYDLQRKTSNTWAQQS